MFHEDGVCSACRNFELRKSIDWQKRCDSFSKVAENAKAQNSPYDCLIPVSGGKDSTWQTIVCLEHGLRPLCVTWKPPSRTSLGQENLDNLISLGVDHIDYSINPEVEKKFMLKTFEESGSPAIPMHLAIFHIPLRIAVNFRIPLVIWGENSAFEYGDATEERMGFKLDSNWFRKYGVTGGTIAEDWVSPSLSRKELAAYFGPSHDELERLGTLAVFLGYYFPWDVRTSYDMARKNGFKANPQGSNTGTFEFADIDDDFISIHHYLKWHKFGFSRAFDNLSLEIRHGRITRDHAISTAMKLGDALPMSDIEKFCSFSGISTDRFFQIAESFRNTKIWKREGQTWKIPDYLSADWQWSLSE